MFEPNLGEFACFFQCFGGLDVEIVVWGVVEGLFKVDVHHRALDVCVSEQLHDMDDVVGFVVFRRGFPVAQRVSLLPGFEGHSAF